MIKEGFPTDQAVVFLSGAVAGFAVSSALRWLRRLSWHLRSLFRMLKLNKFFSSCMRK